MRRPSASGGAGAAARKALFRCRALSHLRPLTLNTTVIQRRRCALLIGISPFRHPHSFTPPQREDNDSRTRAEHTHSHECLSPPPAAAARRAQARHGRRGTRCGRAPRRGPQGEPHWVGAWLCLWRAPTKEVVVTTHSLSPRRPASPARLSLSPIGPDPPPRPLTLDQHTHPCNHSPITPPPSSPNSNRSSSAPR